MWRKFTPSFIIIEIVIFVRFRLFRSFIMSASSSSTLPTTTTATTAAKTTTPPSSSSRQIIYGFGSTYFHQLGGATPVQLKHQNDDELDEPTVAAYHLTAPPWSSYHNNNNNNNMISHDDDDVMIQDIQCTWTSSIFLTTKGKVYQTGTVHGKLSPTPRPVIIRLPLQVAQIAAGRHFCLAKMEGGLAVCSWGAGHFGQLGQGGKIALLQEPMVMERLLPHIIGAPIQQVAAGGWHGLAITTTGKLWAWGSNRRHQCGILPGSAIVNSSTCDTSSEASLSSTVAYPQPIHCTAEPNAVFSKVACGRAHSVALDEESGNVYCWGSSLYGQCGQSSRKTSVPSPRKVETLAQVHLVDVAAGEFHTLGLTGGGRVFSWGAGSEGQLGHGVSVTFGKPKLVGDLDFRSIMAGQDWKYHNLHSSMTGLHNSQINNDNVQQQHQHNNILNHNHNNNNSVTESSIKGGYAMGDIPFDEGNGGVMASNSESSKRPSRRNSANNYTPSPIQQQPKGKAGGAAAAAGITTAPSAQLGEASENSYTIDTLPGPPLFVEGGPKSVESSPSSSWTIPRIVSVHASGSYSAAISSTGHLYTWGYNDVGMLGLPVPNHLVNIENMNPKTSSLRQLQGCSFDARHLVLLPRRVDALADIYITGISTGPCHLWCWGTPRQQQQQQVEVEDPQQPQHAQIVGRTLYEVQEIRRKKNLQRMRNTPSSPVMEPTSGTSATQEAIQEDIYFDGGTIVESHLYHQDPKDVKPPEPSSSSHQDGAPIIGTPTKGSTAGVAGGSTHSSTKDTAKTPTRTTAAVAATDDNDHSATMSPEKESWRFSMGVGKVLRRLSNPRGTSFVEPKERRPSSRLRNPKQKEEMGGGIPPIPTASSVATAPGASFATPTSSISNIPGAVVPTDTSNNFLSRRHARSRSTPATSRIRSGGSTASLSSRYRKTRKNQQPNQLDESVADVTSREGQQTQQQQRRNKKLSTKVSV